MSALARPLRRTALLLVVVATLAATAASCGYVNPPVLSIAVNSTSEPFFTMSWEDLEAELNPPSSTPGASTTTSPVSYQSSQIAQVLTTAAREQIIGQWADELGVQPTAADEAAAQKQAQGSAPNELQIQLVGIERVLADKAFGSGELDREAQARELFEANLDSYTTAAQTCFHVIQIDPETDPQTGASTPEQIQAALDQAATVRQRIGAETFEAVADDVNAEQMVQQLPGGDAGCRTQLQGFPDEDWAQLTAAAPGTVLEPMAVADQVVFIFRVDENKPEHVPTFDEVADQVYSDLSYLVGEQLFTRALQDRVAALVVHVDPHYGVWDPESIAVSPPEGAAQPTVPTTTTTTPGLSLMPTTTTPVPTTTATATTVPATETTVPTTETTVPATAG